MKKRFPLFIGLTAIILAIFTAVVPVNSVSAAIADGTYQLNYEMKEDGTQNTSIADGYFTKPATLTVENGVQYIQLTVTGSNYIKSLSAPSGPVQVVSEDTENQTRTVKFRVDGDLSQPLDMQMHIVVPDMYDTTHTAQAVFDVSGLDQAPANAEQGTSDNGSGNGEEASSNGEEVVENPETGDDSPIALYALLLLVSAIALFVIWKSRLVRN